MGQMRFQISGQQQNVLWVIYAASRATAEHMAALFRKEGYANVTIRDQEAS